MASWFETREDALLTMRGESKQEPRERCHEADRRADRNVSPRGLAVPAKTVQRGGNRLSRARGGEYLRHGPSRSLAREERRAAHCLCRASLQRGVWRARRTSAHDRADRADFWRKTLHASVQDQRQ